MQVKAEILLLQRESSLCYCGAMSRPPSNFVPARRPDQRTSAKDAFEFLQSHEGLASLLPAAAKMGRLPAEAEQLAPLFAHCSALQIRDGQLQVAVPNAALATRIKQVLPKLQEGLRQKGWPLEGIKLKVQPVANDLMPKAQKKPNQDLPRGAVSSFAELEHALEHSTRNEPLLDALRKLIARRKT